MALEDLEPSAPALRECPVVVSHLRHWPPEELRSFQNPAAASQSWCVVPVCVHERVNQPCVHSVSSQPHRWGWAGAQHPWSACGLLGFLGKVKEEGLWLLGSLFITKLA